MGPAFVIEATIRVGSKRWTVPALIDTGAQGSIYCDHSLAQTLAQETDISILPLPRPKRIVGYQGGQPQELTHSIHPTLTLGGHEDQNAPLIVAKLNQYPIIVGNGYLQAHGLVVDTVFGKLIHYRGRCDHPGAELAHFQLPYLDSQPPTVTQTTKAPTRKHLKTDLDVEAVTPGRFRKLLGEKPAQIFAISREDLLAIQDKPVVKTEDYELHEKVPTAYHNYLDVFSKEASNKLPPHRSYDHEIRTTAPPDIGYAPLRRLSELELHEVKKYIDDGLQKGFIEASDSPIASPTLFVRKANGGLRFCVDYRKLNDLTVKDRYPIPLIDETLSKLTRAKRFTKLDIRQAFHRIRMAPGSKWMTTFRTRFGSYRYLVMPFGLTNAPSTWQHFMNDVLFDLLDDCVVVYLDDILIYSENPDEHDAQVRKVLDRLRVAGLQVDIDKCEFGVEETEFLGLRVGVNGIRMCPERVEAIRAWEAPITVKQTQAFIGLCNFYRRFISGFSSLAKNLIAVTKKNTVFQWGPEQVESFEALKDRIAKSPVLSHFHPEFETRVEVDASDYATGGVMKQKDAEGEWHPIAFFSKKMSPAECNYAIYDKELLAIVQALETWEPDLMAVQGQFRIITDHKGLEYFTKNQKLSRRQARWAEMLTRFNFVIQYRPGKSNIEADHLSRRPQDRPQDNNDERIRSMYQTVLPAERIQLAPITESTSSLLERVTTANRIEPSFAKLRERIKHGDGGPFTNQDGILRYEHRILVPPDLRTVVLDEIHNEPASGHGGESRTYELVRRVFFWEGLYDSAKQFVRNCHTCRSTKPVLKRPAGLLKPLPAPEAVWKHISVDFVGPLPESQGYDTIMVVVDRLSKMKHYVACKAGEGGVGAESTAKLFLANVWKLHGFPDSIVSDRGVAFVSHFWAHLCALLRTSRKLSTAYHPETDGQTEISNKEMERFLRAYTNFQQDDWEAWLPIAEFAANNHPSATTNISPFEVVYGYKPRLSFDELDPAPNETSLSRLRRRDANDYATRMREVWKQAQEAIEWAQESQARYANRSRRELDVQEGDLAWVSTKHLTTGRPSKKLDYKWLGPFRVTKAFGNAYTLDLPTSWAVNKTFNASQIQKDPDDALPGQNPDPPPAIEVSGAREWEVEEILASRRTGKRKTLQFKVHWRGYGPDRTWYDAGNGEFDHSRELIDDFYERSPNAIR